MELQSICVCGAGTMGSGIAQAAAQAGLSALLYDLNPAIIEKARQAIEKNLNQLVDKGKLGAAEKEEVLGRLRFTTQVTDCVADICIEAIVEKMEAKVILFTQLAAINPPAVILASNTSSLSITTLAEALPHPERVAGLHFFNPATIMKLVEVVTTPLTSHTVTQALVQLAGRLGRVPVVCKDSPGFIVNRVARPFYIESLRIAEEGVIDFAQCDRLLESVGFRMGPFRLMDLIGNDVNYAVSCSVYDQLGQPERLRPSPVQQQLVEKQKFGRKSGEGYYSYAGKQ